MAKETLTLTISKSTKSMNQKYTLDIRISEDGESPISGGTGIQEAIKLRETRETLINIASHLENCIKEHLPKDEVALIY